MRSLNKTVFLHKHSETELVNLNSNVIPQQVLNLLPSTINPN